MHIDIWNAYASNNSGAYTIIGSFSTPEDASAVVDLLQPVLRQQSEWADARAESLEPLREFAQRNSLPLEEYFDWPEYSEDNTPRIVAVGHQVVLHHPYTVSLPRLFGQFFYARGGRVETELDHTHHPLVVLFYIWWPAGSSEPGTDEERARILLERLTERGGPLDLSRDGYAPAWNMVREFGHTPLVVGASFPSELVESVAAVREVIERFGARAYVRINEALQEEGDPLAFMRTAESPQ